jgi:glyoxylase-like metal-dependent hydrolase (beta-lactamase superfamily II)
MILETISVGPMEVNCYILASKNNSLAIIIDPGSEARKIRQVLDRYSLTPAFIINTHGHFDHIGCDNDFGVPVYIHSKDAQMLKNPQLNLSGIFASSFRVNSEIRALKDGKIIELDNIRLQVMHVPGHTPGGIALLLEKPMNKAIFTGDTLFCHGIGRTDFAGGNEAMLIKSIRKNILSLPDETAVYPGHGPSSSVGEEKLNNPFLMSR